MGQTIKLNTVKFRRVHLGAVFIAVLYIIAIVEMFTIFYLSSEKTIIQGIGSAKSVLNLQYKIEETEKKAEVFLIEKLNNGYTEELYQTSFATIKDMQNRVNLNELIYSKKSERIKRFFEHAPVNMDSCYQALSSYTYPFSLLARQDGYAFPFSQIEELESFNFESDQVRFLKANMVVLPKIISLNINSISKNELFFLFKNMNAASAQQFIILRDKYKPIKNMNDFIALKEVSELNIPFNEGNMQNTSSFYKLEYTIEYKSIKYNIVSLVELVKDLNKRKLVVQWRKFG